MTRFLTSLAFCSFLLIGGAFLLADSSSAKDDIITQLLAMPAPPPPNPLVRHSKLGFEWARDKRNPPKDDAPIEELMEYWSVQSSEYRNLAYSILPSPQSLDRIRAEIEKNPKTIASYLNIMRDSREGADFVKRIYDNWPAGEGEEDYGGRSSVKQWLKMNSSYFSSQLAKSANGAGEQGEYVSNHNEVLALAKHDWDAVRPTVDRMYGDSGQPVSRVLATWALYRHALAENSMGDTDRYRGELMDIVEDKTATAGMRDLAFDALVQEKEWSGRDEWYYSLLEDETLGELYVNGSLYTGLTTIINNSPPEKYADKMIELVKSTNPIVRAAAARNLGVILDRERPDVVRALLPWLEDPKWAKDTGGTRQRLVSILGTLKMPESVPGLIAALDQKEIRNLVIRDTANSSTNAMANSANAVAYAVNMAANAASSITTTTNSMSNAGGRNVEVAAYPLRDQAIGALAMQGDMRAAPVLRRILREVDGYERSLLVRAILLCKGFTIAEQADAIEAMAETYADQQAIFGADGVSMSNNAVSNTYMMNRPMNSSPMYGGPVMPFRNGGAGHGLDDIKSFLGAHLLLIQEPGDQLVREIVSRISLLEKRDPPIGEALRSILLNWKGAAINALLLKDLKDGKSDSPAVLKLLAARKEIREKQQGDIFDIRNSNPTAAAVAACMLESDTDYVAILNGENVEAKTALFACGRLIRAKIPVREAAKFLSDKDKRLAAAAELFLESEDSPEARSIVLSLHPNEAKILGATIAFWPEKYSGGITPQLIGLFASVHETAVTQTIMNSFYSLVEFREVEKRLQDEIKTDAELLGVYSYTNNFIRIYKDRAVYSWEEDESRYRERALTKEELEDVTGYLAHHKVNELAPFLSCSGGCTSKQLLMLGKQGGRRVFVSSSRTPEFFAGLDAIFADLRSTPAKLRYTLEKSVPGLEILFADENKDAKTVWKNGADIRLVVADKLKRKEIAREIEEAEEAMEEAVADEESDSPPMEKIWEMARKRAFDDHAWFKFDGGRLTDRAAQPDQVEFLAMPDSHPVPASAGQWKARAAGVEVRTNSEGSFKIAGGKMTRLNSGSYSSPVIVGNGRWAVVTKYTDESGPQLVRVNLATGKETVVMSQELPIGRAVAFVPSVNKVLTTGFDYEDHEYGDGSAVEGRAYFWLNAETGAVTPAAGEMRPLGQQTFRALQPAQNAFEFWAAINDRKKNETNVGVYNAKTFSFKPVMTVPKIEFGSMDMWVDAAAGKVYFVYGGHLLSLPLAQKK